MTKTNTTQAHTNKVCLANLHFYIIVLISRSPSSDQYARQPPLIQLPMEKSADSQWPEQTTTLTSWSIIIIVIVIIIITSIVVLNQDSWWKAMMNPCRAWESGGGEGRDRMARVGEDQVTFLQKCKTNSTFTSLCVPTITSLCPHYHLTVSQL